MRLTRFVDSKQLRATTARVFASTGRNTRETSPRRESTLSMSPGPWCEKPLWSLRQHVEDSRMFRLGMRLRQASLPASSSHLPCWMVCDAEMRPKAS